MRPAPNRCARSAASGPPGCSDRGRAPGGGSARWRCGSRGCWLRARRRGCRRTRPRRPRASAISRWMPTFHWFTRAGRPPLGSLICAPHAGGTFNCPARAGCPDRMRPIQVVGVVDETVLQPQRRFAERRVGPVDRVEADAERRRAAGHVPPVRERAVGDAPAARAARSCHRACRSTPAAARRRTDTSS